MGLLAHGFFERDGFQRWNPLDCHCRAWYEPVVRWNSAILPGTFWAVLLRASDAGAEPYARTGVQSGAPDLAYVAVGALLTPLVSGLMAGWLCRIFCRRRREPPLRIIGIICGGVLLLAAGQWFGVDVFVRPNWLPPADIQDRFLFVGLPSVAAAIMVATAVVLEQRRRFAEDSSLRRRRHLERRHKAQKWRWVRWVHLGGSVALIVVSTLWFVGMPSRPFAASMSAPAAAADPPLDAKAVEQLDANGRVQLFEQGLKAPLPEVAVGFEAFYVVVYLFLLGMTGAWLAFTLFRWRRDTSARLDPGLALWANLP